MCVLNKRCSVLIVVIALVSSAPAWANWPTWRGPAGDGIATESNAPTNWSPQDQVRWKVDLPEPGNSTPIIWGQRVFLTQPMNAGKQRTIICFDRLSGEKLWQEGVDAVEMEPTHRTNPYCSPSAVTDGEHVIAWFGSNGLVAFDMHGNLQWQRPLGSVKHVFGYGASPIIVGDLCFLNFGPGEREFAVAVNKRSGEIVWKHDAPKPKNPPGDGRDIHGMWSTPLMTDDGVIFCFRDTIVALEPETGKPVWTCHGLGPQTKASPVAGDGVLVVFGGRDSATLAIRLGGRGDVTDTRVLWRYPQAKARLGTGVIHDGHLYANRRNGVLECVELQTGSVVWEKRPRGNGPTVDTWSSLTLADGRVYAMNQSGDVFVFKASPQYELIATNSLDQHTNSTVAIAHGDAFIRTHETLWCLRP